jgi:hypothetical protein
LVRGQPGDGGSKGGRRIGDLLNALPAPSIGTLLERELANRVAKIGHQFIPFE